MSRPDVTQRVRIVAGPRRWCSGVTTTHYDPSDPTSRAPVRVCLDSSGLEVEVLSCQLRPEVYEDSSGLEEAT